MDFAQLSYELLRTARDAPSEALFSKDSSMDLARVIIDGVRAMVETGRTEESDLQLARTNLIALLEAMNEERLTNGLQFFTESTVAGARFRLCPGLFPFC